MQYAGSLNLVTHLHSFFSFSVGNYYFFLAAYFVFGAEKEYQVDLIKTSAVDCDTVLCLCIYC